MQLERKHDADARACEQAEQSERQRVARLLAEERRLFERLWRAEDAYYPDAIRALSAPYLKEAKDHLEALYRIAKDGRRQFEARRAG